MNYIVYDLEFNQKNPNDTNPTKLTFEIVQIGAVKLNNDLEITAVFNKIIRPSVHFEIHPYIENLTRITTEMVATENYFPEVYNDFLKFIGEEDFTTCTWGTADIKELIKNIRFHNLDPLNNLTKYIDIQKIVSKQLHRPKGEKIGLKRAIEFFNLPIEREFHDALNDAYYTAEIFKKIYTPEVKPEVYHSTQNKRQLKPKQKIYTEQLFAQFEKMYNRKLSPNEKDMIKLAYIMGKTNQFSK